MINEKIFREIEGAVTRELACAAHDLAHVKRVYTTACLLAETEPGVDMMVVQAAALLHDIAKIREDRDHSGQTDHALLGATIAETLLRRLGCQPTFVTAVTESIRCHRFKGSNRPTTREAQVLFDADKIDVLGAVGLARSYIIAGQYGQSIFSETPINDYVKDNLVDGNPKGRIKEIAKHAPNLEFELKLKAIPDILFTPRARDIAKDRLAYMAEFFAQLRTEMGVGRSL